MHMINNYTSSHDPHCLVVEPSVTTRRQKQFLNVKASAMEQLLILSQTHFLRLQAKKEKMSYGLRDLVCQMTKQCLACHNLWLIEATFQQSCILNSLKPHLSTPNIR